MGWKGQLQEGMLIHVLEGGQELGARLASKSDLVARLKAAVDVSARPPRDTCRVLMRPFMNPCLVRQLLSPLLPRGTYSVRNSAFVVDVP